MKIFKSVTLNGQEVDLQSEHIILELNNAGRGFITVKTDQPCEGAEVIFHLGDFDHYHQWFKGYVEEAQNAENGFKRLFIRENVAIFEKNFNFSYRHITLIELCQRLSQATGFEVYCPEDQPYSQAPIAQFTHKGSGFQLLQNVGRQFQIEDFIWQQFPDGSVFVGSWEQSPWQDDETQVEIDTAQTLEQASNFLEIPINAEIRPGCIVNGQRINKVTLQGDIYKLEWQALNAKGKPLRKNANQRMIEQNFPELAGGYHLSHFAKVVAVADPSVGGEISDPFRPKYAVDIQLLDENGNEDSNVPLFTAVPLPVTSTASQGGDFAFPEIGTVVEIGFVNGRSDKPIIRNFYPTGKTIPAVGVGEMIRQQRPEVFERTDSAGNMHKETDQTISEKSFSRKIITDHEEKTLGSSSKTVENNEQKNVGGNQSVSVMGNVEEITASDRNVGVGGNLSYKIAGTAEMISQAKIKLIGATAHIGTESQNIFSILENLLQIVADLANETANHTHAGVGQPIQKANFQSYNRQARAEKNKLSPIIG